MYFALLYVFCLHVCVCTTCVPGAQGSQKRCWTPWNWRWLWWMLGSKPRSSARTASVPKSWATSRPLSCPLIGRATGWPSGCLGWNYNLQRQTREAPGLHEGFSTHLPEKKASSSFLKSAGLQLPRSEGLKQLLMMMEYLLPRPPSKGFLPLPITPQNFLFIHWVSLSLWS